MQEVTRDAIVSITLFAAVFGMVYVFLMTRHRERMVIIERLNGVNPFPRTDFSTLGLKYGIFFVGLSVAIFAGYALEKSGMDEVVSYSTMTFLFGGLSLIAGHFFVKKQQK